MKTTFLAVLVLMVDVSLAQKQEVWVNEKASPFYPNEPTIAINRQNPSLIVVCANINNQYVSHDTGKTWEYRTVKSSYGVYGDPVLHATSDGMIYLTHLSKTSGKKKEKKYRFIDRMVVQPSKDGSDFDNGSDVGYNDGKIQDKPWLSSNDEKGELYITWTEFDRMNSKRKKDKSRIRFAKSTDSAASWSNAITISEGVGDCVDDDHTLEGATTATGPNGTIYCVWAGHNLLYFDKSEDGGKTWGVDKIVGEQQSGWVIDIPEVYRTNGMPFIVCDRSNGTHRGRIYLVYGDTIHGDADILLMYSDDEGSTWSQPIRVNGDSVGNGKSQYLPNLAIDQTTGDLAVIYYDRRESENNLFNDVYLALSTDGSETFKEIKLNTWIAPPHGKTSFSGDYIDIDFHNGRIATVWASMLDQQRLFSKVMNIEEIEDYFSPILNNQIAFYSASHGRYKKLYVRLNQPVKVECHYHYKQWLGWKKVSVNLTESVDCAYDGSATVEYEIDYPNFKKYSFNLKMTNGERQVFKTETISK